MHRHTHALRRRRVLGVGVAIATAAVVASAGSARSAASTCTDDGYAIALTALTGPQGADLKFAVSAVPGCAPAETLEKVQVKTYDADGGLADVLNVKDVAVDAALPLGQLGRGRRIEADALVRTASSPRTYVVRSATTTQLRPDLTVAAVLAPAQTLTTRPVDVVVDVRELNGDTGATATVVLSWGTGSTSAPATVTAGGAASVTFSGIALTAPAATTVVAELRDIAPVQTDASNDARTATVDVTEHELSAPRNVLFPSLGGYGAQFNNHVYAPITPWPPGAGYGNFEGKVKALEPQLVRIFYQDNWDGNWDGKHPEWQQNYASFVKVVRLAQESGATIDISFQNLANAKAVPAAAMAKFADVIEDLVRNNGLTNVRWVEVGNEPNSGTVTLEEYNALYRAMHAQLVARGLRDHIQLMGGGLVENANNPVRNHYEWMKWIAANMGDILDGYAEHVYWTYNDPGRLEYRLRDTDNLMNVALPPEQRKPTYMMEFGIRGVESCGTKPTVRNMLQYYGGDASCPEIWRTNIAAFQQLWFFVDSAQLGVAGASKWDAYWGRYDLTLNNQYYWTIGPAAEGSPLMPTYHALSLLFHVTAPGWQIVRVDPWDESDWRVPAYQLEGHVSSDQPEKELVGYAGPNGELTLVGLDTHGRDLNTASAEQPVAYSIGGLPANANLTLAVWNATGDGTNSIAGLVPTNAAGVARFHVPLHAAFALTTQPVE